MPPRKYSTIGPMQVPKEFNSIELLSDTFDIDRKQLVLVNVCGHQLVANCDQKAPSLQVLRETVQRGIGPATGLQPDWIQLFDNNGCQLMTDGEVCTAISNGQTPIHAVISDHVVHQFQLLQEESAHMQWKVMRDEVKVLKLQQQHTQQQVKDLVESIQKTNHDNATMIGVMKEELGDGLTIVGDCKTNSITMQEIIGKLNDIVHSVGLKVDQEAVNRDSAMQSLDSKMERLSKTQKHENAMLQELLGTRIKLVDEATEQIGSNMQALHKQVAATRDLANTHHEDALKQVADARAIAARATSDAIEAVLKQAHDDAEVQVNELGNAIAEFKTRIVRGESLASDTANKWLASNEQLKEQYNSVTQAVEQCRLANRTNQASTHEMQNKLELHAETVQSLSIAVKQEHARERKAREEHMKTQKQNLDGTLKSAIAELESRLMGRVDRETDARKTSIVQALDDIGTVLEKEIPSKIRDEKEKRCVKQHSTTLSTSVSGPVGMPASNYSVSGGQRISPSRRASPVRSPCASPVPPNLGGGGVPMMYGGVPPSGRGSFGVSEPARGFSHPNLGPSTSIFYESMNV